MNRRAFIVSMSTVSAFSFVFQARPAAATSGRVRLWENINFGGRYKDILQSGQSSKGFTLPGRDRDSNAPGSGNWPYHQASSIELFDFDANHITVFLETPDKLGDDALVVIGSGRLANLLAIRRPHGDNNWNDLIAQVRFDISLPALIVENRTQINHGSRDYYCGNEPTHQLDGNNADWG